MKNNKIYGIIVCLFFLLSSYSAKAQEVGIENESSNIGGTIALTVLFIVLVSALIRIALKDFGYLDKFKNRKTRTDGERNQTEVKSSITDYVAEDENMAAITMAIHLYTSQMHDEESEVITFEDFSRPYSPWSQKHLLFKNRLPQINRRK